MHWIFQYLSFSSSFFGWSQFLFSIGFSYGVKTSSFINSFHLEHHLNHIAPVVKFLSEVFFFFFSKLSKRRTDSQTEPFKAVESLFKEI